MDDAPTQRAKPTMFDEALAPLSSGEALIVPRGWGQGRATFGGLVAAFLYRRARAVVDAESGGAPARSLSFSLVAPLAPGEARVEARILRSGKSVTQVEARVLQGGQVAAMMLGSFGASRASEIRVAPPPVPVYPSPASIAPLPYMPGLTPEFTQQFDFRWAVGSAPFTGQADEAEIGGWVRFREPTRELGVEHLLGLVDAWPPAVLPMFPRPAPASTLTWTIEFTDASAGAPTGDDGPAFFGYLATTELAASGYAHIASRFWRADGTLLAIGRQTVAVFA